MAADPTQIKNDIDSDLANKGYRGIRVVNVISALKKTVDWVAGVVANHYSSWLRITNGTPSGNNTDTIYHVGRTILGRTVDDGSEALLQVEGYANFRDGIFAGNADGTNPPAQSLGGQAILRFLANWALPGFSDLGLLNTNPISAGIGFWQLTGDVTKRRLLMMLRFGRVGIGTTDPEETLHVVGRAQVEALVSGGASAATLPTVGGIATGIIPTFLDGSTDFCGTLKIVTQSNPANNANLVTVIFNRAYNKAPRVMLSAASVAAPGGLQTLYVVSTSTTGFTVACGSALAANNTFLFNYLVIG